MTELRAKLGDADAWPDPARISVDPSHLSIEERAMILYSHAKAANLGDRARDAVRANADALVHDHTSLQKRVREASCPAGWCS